MRKRWIIVLSMALALLVTGCGKEESKTVQGEKVKEEKIVTSQPLEMSATAVNSMGGRTMKSKFYMKSGKFRVENEAADGTYMIIRQDLKKSWMVMPANKSYMEILEPGPERQSLPVEKVKGEVSRKEVGREVIDGYQTIKYEITAKVDGKSMTTYQWLATEIRFPVKMAALDGSWTLEYKDIKVGDQADSLFELPAGYKKAAMPTIPRNIKGMVPGKPAKE